MASYQLKIILKVLFLHLKHYPFSTHGIAVPTNAVELLTSKLVCDPIENNLRLAMRGLLTCLNTGRHLSIFDFLVDSYVAVSILNDRNWKDDKPIATNVHVMLKRIRDEVIKLIKALVDRHVGVLTGNIMDVGGTFPAATRADYNSMDPFEVLGIKNHIRYAVISEWDDKFLAEVKEHFEAEGLKEYYEALYPQSERQ